jgi:hypothetical protein
VNDFMVEVAVTKMLLALLLLSRLQVFHSCRPNWSHSYFLVLIL